MESSTCSPQLEEACLQQGKPRAEKKKKNSRIDIKDELQMWGLEPRVGVLVLLS